MNQPWNSPAGADRHSRRQFMIRSGMAVGAGGVASRASAADGVPPSQDAHVAFFVVGDTHYFADPANPSRLDEASAAVTQGLIDQLNALVGQEIPDRAGGGVVRRPFGVIHAGDIIDTGDKTGKLQSEMQCTEMAAFERSMGLTGRDAALDFPVYEVHGNHDGPSGTGHAIDRIIERTKARPHVSHVSTNGLHYSWDVGDVHFVNLGIVVGSVPGIARRRRYAPRESLEFLQKDLTEKVGTSGRPVIVTHHVDIARYTTPVPDDAPFSDKEWDPADVGGFHAALCDCNVAGIFYGHTHGRNVWRWDGVSTRPAGERLADEPPDTERRRSFDVFNVDNSSHFGGPRQALFYVECSPAGLTVREYATQDAWKTGAWTPLVWRRAAAVASCLVWALAWCVATAAVPEAATIDANIGTYCAAFIGNYKGIPGPGSRENRFFPVLGNHDWDAPGVDSDGREPDGTDPGPRACRAGSRAIASMMTRTAA